MRSLFTLGFVLANLVASVLPAQVKTDGTVGPRATLAGPNFNVIPSLGRQVGPNLFHSFESFSLTVGQSATFSGPTTVKNVLARVTGGSVSRIAGRLACDIDGANLYLINPSGVVFGAGATLDVKGSFVVTTADVVHLTGGGRFPADPAAGQLLTSAPPAAFGFLRQSARPTVSVNGASLAVPAGRSLSVVAGGIAVTGGTVGAPAGRINLVAPPAVSTVTLDPASADAPLTLNNAKGRGTIALTGGAVVSVDGAGGGRLEVNGGDVSLTDTSFLRARTTGNLDGRGINVNVDSLTLLGASQLDGSPRSGMGRGGDVTVVAGSIRIDGSAAPQGEVPAILSKSPATPTGPGGNIRISARSISIRATGEINVTTENATDAGNVRIDARDLSIDGNGGDPTLATGILASSLDEATGGRGGDLALTLNSLRLVAGGQISSGTLGPGDAGAVSVTVAGLMSVDRAGSNDFTGVTSQTRLNATGRGGPVTVSAGALSLLGGGSISSTTFNSADGGPVNVTVKGALVIDGSGSDSFTGISSSSDNDMAGGRAGGVTVSAGSLSLLGGGQITSDTFGLGAAGRVAVTATGALVIDGSGTDAFTGISSTSQSELAGGDAGAVSVAAGRLTIVGGGAISSDTFGLGAAGDVGVSARHLTIDGSAEPGFVTGISSDSASPADGGSAGSVKVSAGTMLLLAGGQISSDTFSTGDAGAVSVAVRGRMAIDGAGADSFTGVSSDSKPGATGRAGSVAVSADTLSIVGGGKISSTTFGTGDAGRVSVRTKRSLTIDGSTSQFLTAIRSTSNDTDAGGNAGSIDVFSPRLFVLGGGQISSGTFGMGNGGDVRVIADHILISGSEEGISSIRASSENETAGGKAGDISISSHSLAIRGDFSRVSASSNAGVGGSVLITTGTLSLSEGALISTRSTANTAGDIVIEASRGVSLSDRRRDVPPATESFKLADPRNTRITAHADVRDGGNVTINTPGYVTLYNSLITARAAGAGATLTIDPPVVTLNHSVIDGKAVRADVHVTIDAAARLITSPDSLILSDNVTLPPPIDLAGSLANFDLSLANDALTLADQCAQRIGGDFSSFLILGRGATPADPSGLSPSFDLAPRDHAR